MGRPLTGLAVALGLLAALPAVAQVPPAVPASPAPANPALPPIPAAPGPVAPGPVAPGSTLGSSELSLDTAVLQGLDKVTARVVTVEAPVGTPVHMGALEVIVRACKKRRPEDQPESAAFLDIWELRKDQPAAALFRGWMFASSPALSAMEHPVYDLWVLDCRGKAR